jgi:hypothetical protein
MFLQNTESPQARDLAMLQNALGGVADAMGTAARMSKTRRAAQYGSNLEEGKKTVIEWNTQVDNGPSDDASNAHFFPPDAYKMPGGEVVNPWVTPKKGELDPLWDHALGVVDSMTDGLGDAAVRGYREGFALPYYKALIRRRQKIATEYNSEITKSHIGGLLGTQEDGETPMHELGEDELFRIHAEELGMYDPEGNPVQPFNMTKEAWKISHILAAAELAEAKGWWDLAEVYVTMGEAGDPIQAAGLQAKIDAGRQGEALDATRDSFGRAVHDSINLHSQDMIGAFVAGDPAAAEEAMLGLSDVVNSIGRMWVTYGGSANSAARTLLKDALEGAMATSMRNNGPVATRLSLKTIMGARWHNEDTGEVEELAPIGSPLHNLLSGELNKVLEVLEKNNEDQQKERDDHRELEMYVYVNEQFELGEDAGTIRDGLKDKFGDHGIAFQTKVGSIYRSRNVAVDDGELWSSYLKRLQLSRSDGESRTIVEEVMKAQSEGLLNGDRTREAWQLYQGETIYEQWKTYSGYITRRDGLRNSVRSVLGQGEGTKYAFEKPEYANIAEVALPLLLEEMDLTWRKFYTDERFHALASSEDPAKVEVAERMARDFSGELLRAYRDKMTEIMRTTLMPDPDDPEAKGLWGTLETNWNFLSDSVLSGDAYRDESLSFDSILDGSGVKLPEISNDKGTNNGTK